MKNKLLKKLMLFLLSVSIAASTGILAACNNDDESKAPCTTHVDANDDGKCDNCGADMPGGGNEETPGGNEETPGDGEEESQLEIWQSTAQYTFTNPDRGACQMYLLPDGTAKFLPSTVSAPNEVYSGTWTAENGTLKLKMNKTDDVTLAGGASDAQEYTVTATNGTYSVTLPTVQAGRDQTLTFTGETIAAPSDSTEQTPGEEENTDPRTEWAASAEYIFMGGRNGDQQYLFLLEDNTVKAITSTSHLDETLSGSSWSYDEATNTFTIMLNTIPDQNITAENPAAPETYTVTLTDGAYSFTYTYFAGQERSNAVTYTPAV